MVTFVNGNVVATRMLAAMYAVSNAIADYSAEPRSI
jgi:hypothetical protein